MTKRTIAQKRASRKYYLKNKKKYIERAKARISVIDTYVREQKMAPCTDCKKNYPPCVLQFDHLRDKIENVSAMARKGYSLEAIKREIAKCEVVCANCHCIRTNNRRLGPIEELNEYDHLI